MGILGVFVCCSFRQYFAEYKVSYRGAKTNFGDLSHINTLFS